jgi:hypothetical protein
MDCSAPRRAADAEALGFPHRRAIGCKTEKEASLRRNTGHAPEFI